jgi:hypothetical protein
VKPLKIFRAQQRPYEIDKQTGGDDAAEIEVEHELHLLAAFDVEDQQNKHGNAVEYGNSVTHNGPPFRERICAASRKAATGKRGTGHKDGVKIRDKEVLLFLKKTQQKDFF